MWPTYPLEALPAGVRQFEQLLIAASDLADLF